MKKNLIWIIIGLIVVIAIVSFSGRGKDDTKMEDKEVAVEQDATNLSGAFAGVASVRCEYADDKTGAKNTVFIKDGKVKIISEADKAVANIIYVNDKVYVWSNTSGTKGFVYTTAELESANATTGVFSRTAFENQLKGISPNCEELEVGDGEFALPAGVAFKSVAEILGR